jgi:hypothetical protein
MIEVLVIASAVEERNEEALVGGRADAAGAFICSASALEHGEMARAAMHLEAAARALQTLVRAECAARGDLLARAADEHRVVALEEMRPLADEVLVYDEYFGIGRIARSSFSEQAAAAAPVLLALCRELVTAPITLDARSDLARFAARVLGSDTDEAPDREELAPAQLEQVALDGPLQRWKLGHLLYSLANRTAAKRLRAAIERLPGEDGGEVCALLREAARDVEAGSAAMELASAESRRQYCRVVRPTMCPPALSLSLSGAMNADHHALRQAVSRLLLERGKPFGGPAPSYPAELAAAIERLLDADVADLERHITLSLRLVGSGPALDEAAEQSAVGSLRVMYLERLQRYAAMSWPGLGQASRYQTVTVADA